MLAGGDIDEAWAIAIVSLEDMMHLAMNLVPHNIKKQGELLQQVLGGDQSWLPQAFKDASLRAHTCAQFCQFLGIALHLLRGHLLFGMAGDTRAASLRALMDGLSVQLCKGATHRVLSDLAQHMGDINEGDRAQHGDLIGQVLSILRQMTTENTQADQLGTAHPLLDAPPYFIYALGVAVQRVADKEQHANVRDILSVWLHTARAAVAEGVPVPHPEHMAPAVCKLLMNRWVQATGWCV